MARIAFRRSPSGVQPGRAPPPGAATLPPVHTRAAPSATSPMRLTADEIDRQLTLLRAGPPAMRLARPATLGDGICQPDPAIDDRHELLGRRAAEDSLLTKFVPASGAATRMFAPLVRLLGSDIECERDALERRRQDGDRTAERLLELFATLPTLGVGPVVEAELARRGTSLSELLSAGRFRPIVETMLDPSGLQLQELPKALVPFHLRRGEPRTALDEQLEEGVSYLRDRNGVSRFHFTVPSGWEETFLAAAGSSTAASDGSLAVDASMQDPATDTIAIDTDGEPVRDAAGELVTRPGGHGALLGNLERVRTDLAVLRNVDNILPAGERRQLAITWQRRLVGLLVATLEERRRTAGHLHSRPPNADSLDEAHRFVAEYLGRRASPELRSASPESQCAWLLEQLERPLRVCGMVPNRGEPGGGPFWVHEENGSLSLQIVEGAQVGTEAEQIAVWESATHFNPVFMVVSLRRDDASRYRLEEFCDPHAVIVTEKQQGPRRIRVLERPGLWNGGMAGWGTLLVELPAAVFAPVKSVFDLLRPEHRSNR